MTGKLQVTGNMEGRKEEGIKENGGNKDDLETRKGLSKENEKSLGN